MTLLNILEGNENDFIRHFFSLLKLLRHLYLIELFIKDKIYLIFEYY